MDFSKFDARTAAETARPYHLLDQNTRAPIWDGDKPCRILVQGTSSRSAQARIKDAARAAVKTDADTSPRTFEDLQAESIVQAKRLIVGLENIDRDDRPCTTSDEDLQWLLDMTLFSVARDPVTNDPRTSFAQQIINFAADDASFLAAASKPSPSPRRK